MSLNRNTQRLFLQAHIINLFGNLTTRLYRLIFKMLDFAITFSLWYTYRLNYKNCGAKHPHTKRKASFQILQRFKKRYIRINDM